MKILSKADTLAHLLPEWQDDLMPAIQSHLRNDRRKVVVLDDDPTGTQTVHHVPVLTHWSIEALAAELQAPGSAFFILTNSRGLQPEEAAALNHQIGINLHAAARQTHIHLSLISRSDSTLRGHFPAEVIALASGWSETFDATLIVPFFLEGGRFTIENIHYVAKDEQLIPAGETEFARDATFGFRSSDLRAWVEEKTKGAVHSSDVALIHLEDLRAAGPMRVLEKLMALSRGQYCVVDAVSYRDLEVLVLALLQAEDQGKRFIARTAASFVRVRAGIMPQPLLNRETLAQDVANGGLVIVGSHVPRTNAQLAALRASRAMDEMEIAVPDLLNAAYRQRWVADATQELIRTLRAGKNVLVFTSRTVIAGKDGRESLQISQIVSASLVQLVQQLTVRPRFLVAKGGITSSDIATQGLGVKRAIVLGQILPGVPVWQLGRETRFPGLPYVVFPGNVGDEQALLETVTVLSNRGEAKL